MTEVRDRARLAPWGLGLALVLLLNLVFLGLALWTASAPRERFGERVRSAFAAGDLLAEDYRVFDSRRGFHQYDECLILQMLANAPESPFERQSVRRSTSVTRPTRVTVGPSSSWLSRARNGPSS